MFYLVIPRSYRPRCSNREAIMSEDRVGGSVRALSIAVLLAFACGGDELGPDGPTATKQVSVVDNRFNPSANIVQPGDTVTWTWGGNNLHNVTFDDAMVGNSTTQTSGTFTKAFAGAGEFTYYCTVHGQSVMSGRVVVGEASSGSNGTSY